MTHDQKMRVSERWFRSLLWLYPEDFRDELGFGIVEAYQDKARAILDRNGALGLAWLWLRAFADALWNGLGERLWPSNSWRRKGLELAAAPSAAKIPQAALTAGAGPDHDGADRQFRRGAEQPEHGTSKSRRRRSSESTPLL